MHFVWEVNFVQLKIQTQKALIMKYFYSKEINNLKVCRLYSFSGIKIVMAKLVLHSKSDSVLRSCHMNIYLCIFCLILVYLETAVCSLDFSLFI